MKVEFGKRLAELRKDRGLTKSQLAEVFYVTRTTIYHWEKEIQQPSFEVLVDIAQFFQVSVGYLLGTED